MRIPHQARPRGRAVARVCRVLCPRVPTAGPAGRWRRRSQLRETEPAVSLACSPVRERVGSRCFAHTDHGANTLSAAPVGSGGRGGGGIGIRDCCGHEGGRAPATALRAGARSVLRRREPAGGQRLLRFLPTAACVSGRPHSARRRDSLPSGMRLLRSDPCAAAFAQPVDSRCRGEAATGGSPPLSPPPSLSL